MSKISKKILVIAPAINKTSGWGRLVYEVINQFQKKSIEYGICAEQADPAFKTASFFQLERGFVGFVRNTIAVRRIARHYDIIHAFDGWPYSIYGYVASLASGKKLYITGVGTYSVLPLTSWWKSIFMKKAYLRARRIMCISRYTEEQILEKVPTAKTSVVHMGLTVLPKLSPEIIEEKRKKFNIPSNHRVLLTVGAIKNRKGQYDVVAAVLLLIKKYPDLLYIMVGSNKDTAYVDSIKKLVQTHHIEKHIRIISNATSDEDLSFFYHHCDVFLLVSRNSIDHHFEGFGLVIVEAAQFGRPAVGTLDCGVADAILEGQTGFLVTQGRPDMIAGAVEKILTAGSGSFSEKCRAFANSFSWEATVTGYLTAYEQ